MKTQYLRVAFACAAMVCALLVAMVLGSCKHVSLFKGDGFGFGLRTPIGAVELDFTGPFSRTEAAPEIEVSGDFK